MRIAKVLAVIALACGLCALGPRWSQSPGSRTWWRPFEEYWLKFKPGMPTWGDPIEEAPVIVCGTLNGERVGEETERMAFGQPVEGYWRVMDMAVDDVIKGIDQDTKMIQVFAPTESPMEYLGSEPYYSLRANVRYLLFLKPSGDRPGLYRLLRSREGMPPPLPLAARPPEQKEAATIRARLIVELMATAQQRDVELAAPAIPVLGYVGNGNPRVTRLLRKLARNRHPDLAVLAGRSLARSAGALYRPSGVKTSR